MSITEMGRSFVMPVGVEFPESISSTSVGLLLHNPYTFYAKHILKLKHLDRFKDKPNLADFGIFMHCVLDQYTKSYRCGPYSEHVSRFLSIARSVLQQMHLHKQDLWLHKIEGIAQEFVDFDLVRRADLSKVWSEQKGHMMIKLSKVSLRLTAIADRIELSDKGDVCILDYKTGVMPSAQEVRMGLSPQMIVSSIIASKGGFACLNRPLAPSKIVYVKLASCSPYWRSSDIMLNDGDLERHLDQLVALLETLMSGAELKFSPGGNPIKRYDEYVHLSRVFSYLD
jgi:ATP-dependent helicase/nuclease subunit B